jgi:hypothetical protein
MTADGDSDLGNGMGPRCAGSIRSTSIDSAFDDDVRIWEYLGVIEEVVCSVLCVGCIAKAVAFTTCRIVDRQAASFAVDNTKRSDMRTE